MLKPVHGLHGLSPTEDWIRQCNYLEQEREATLKRAETAEARIAVLTEALGHYAAHALWLKGGQRGDLRLYNGANRNGYDVAQVALDVVQAALADGDAVKGE